MPRFRNTRTGRVVDVPEEAPTRQRRPKRDKQWAANITRMLKSKRWERVTERAEPTGPTPADVRAWARDQGIEVSTRGKLPDDLVADYIAATGDA